MHCAACPSNSVTIPDLTTLVEDICRCKRKVDDCGRLLNNLEAMIHQLKDCLPVHRFELITQQLCKGLADYCSDVQDATESVMPTTTDPFVADSLKPIYSKLQNNVTCWDIFYSYDQLNKVWGKI